jgi:hypothetical protein
VASIGSNTTETATIGSDLYFGFATFDAATAGSYQVTVRPSAGAQASMLISPSVGSLFTANLVWLVVGLLAGVTAVVGFMVMLVGLIRRGRAHRRLPPPPVGPGGSMPAWPPTQGAPPMSSPPWSTNQPFNASPDPWTAKPGGPQPPRQ